MQVRSLGPANTAVLVRLRDLAPVWFWVGAGIYALLSWHGVLLLNDSDTYWHISIGNWILDHRAFPEVDFYSFTRPGEPWISTSWLAQVLYALAYRAAGWAGPIVLASAATALTFALLAQRLCRYIPGAFAVMVSLAALVLSTPHLLARPHVLVLPLVLIWTSGLVEASRKGEAPPLLLLPVIALWANLHGGFVFGLVLAAGFAVDALWNAVPDRRLTAVVRWGLFGVAALLACCVTPYGWGSILASRRILDLGELLHLISEWMPANFATFGPFEACVLGCIGLALYTGVRLTPPRILIVLGLLHMALSHVRNIEIFAVLVPLVVVEPIARQFRLRSSAPVPSVASAGVMMVAVLVLAVSGVAYATQSGVAPTPVQSPAGAVDALLSHKPRRILNDLPFGGYLIWRNVPVFIDGRAELYGEKFEMDFFRAMQLKDVAGLLAMLERYDIDAVILTPQTPAVGLLDQLPAWRRVYADENAVVHLRTGR